MPITFSTFLQTITWLFTRSRKGNFLRRIRLVGAATKSNIHDPADFSGQTSFLGSTTVNASTLADNLSPRCRNQRYEPFFQNITVGASNCRRTVGSVQSTADPTGRRAVCIYCSKLSQFNIERVPAIGLESAFRLDSRIIPVSTNSK